MRRAGMCWARCARLMEQYYEMKEQGEQATVAFKDSACGGGGDGANAVPAQPGLLSDAHSGKRRGGSGDVSEDPDGAGSGGGVRGQTVRGRSKFSRECTQINTDKNY